MNIGGRRRNDFRVPDLAVFPHVFTTKDTKSTKGLKNKTLKPFVSLRALRGEIQPVSTQSKK